MATFNSGELAALVAKSPELIQKANRLAHLALEARRGDAKAANILINMLDLALGHRDKPEGRGGKRIYRHRRRVGRGRSAS